MENLLELKPGVILRGITENQYKKLESITSSAPRAIKANVSMPDCGMIRVEVFFRNTNQLSQETNLEQYIEMKRNFVTLENQSLLRFSYYNYAKKRWETRNEHPDFQHLGGFNSIKTALSIIQPSYAYIIATKKEEDVETKID